jgi:hypothetical protein
VLLARSLLRHRLFSLAGLPVADRIGALQAQLLAWQPFVDSLVLVDLHGEQAQAYALPRALVQEAGLRPELLWPESLCHAPLADGLHLLQRLEGVEGQCWQGGVLLASRWWAAVPELGDWQAFARQSRAPAQGATGVPVPQALPWQRPLRSPRPAEQLGRAAASHERLLVGAGALMLLVFSSMTARAGWDAYQAREQAQAAVAQLRQDVTPLLAARDKALAAADQSAALLAQLQAPQPLEVLEELGRLLPKGSTVKEFDLNQLTVRVALELPAEVSRAKVITELESGAWFTQISEVKDGVARSGISLEMKLAAARPPTRQQATGADAGLSRGAADLPAPPPGIEAQAPTPKPAGAKKP